MTHPEASAPAQNRQDGGGRVGHAGRAALAALVVGLLVSNRALLGLGARAAGRASEGLDQALYEPSMMEPGLALFAFALLAFRRRSQIVERLSAGRGTPWGIAVLALGIAILLWSRQIDADRLLVPSLILQLLGAALMAGGAPLARALGLPFAALATAVPLPPQILQSLVYPLQLWTVSLSSALLDLLGRSHEVLGDLVLYRGDRFQVIEGCSGFKTIVSLVLAAIVYADFIVRDARKKGILIALAVPIGLFVNGVRVVMLILGRIPTESAEHTAYGLLAMVAGVVLVAVTEMSWTVVAGLRSHRPSPSPSPAPTSAAEPADLRAAGEPSGRRGPPRPGLAVLLIVVSTCAAEIVPRGAWPAPGPGLNIESLPETLDGRTARPLAVDDAWLGNVRFGHRIHRSYDAAAPDVASIRVFIGLEDVASAEHTGDSPKTFIPRSGWRTIERRPAIEVGGEAGESGDWSGVWERRVIDYPDRRVLVERWRTGFAPWGLEVLGRWLGADRAGWMGTRRAPLVIRLEIDASVDEETGWLSLRQLASRVEAWRASTGR